MTPAGQRWTREYSGKLYVRPCGRGWCVYDSSGDLGNDLEEYLNLSEGDYEIELKVRPITPNEATE